MRRDRRRGLRRHDNEGGASCARVPGSAASCCSGPAGTLNAGICAAGTHVCNAQGTAYGACTGETLPATESCSSPPDDDCDGMANAGCTSFAAHVRPILQARCGTCHTSDGLDGGNFASNYASSQGASAICPRKTKGECSLIRIQDGSMPPGAGCTGDPAIDVGNRRASRRRSKTC